METMTNRNKPTRRVLHMIGSLNIGGSQSMVVNLLKNMDKNDVIFDFIIDHPEELFYKNIVESYGSKIYIMPSFKGYNWGQIRKAWRDFFKSHNEYKILHSHVRSYASLYLPIAKEYGVKTIIHSHSTSNGSGLSALVKSLMQYPLRYQADYFMACSENAGKWLFGNKITKKNNFMVLKNAIEANKYYFNEDVRAQYRKDLGINSEYVYIHVGRFHPSKNHEFLLNLFKKIHEINSNTKLILVGDGELRANIEKQINELMLSDSVILVGAVSNPYDYLQAADCFLFPSLWEGLGMVAVEAQASGLLCLCSDNVPKEVKVSELCKFLNLINFDSWIEESLPREYKRLNMEDSITQHGYNINHTARILSEIYRGILDD